MNDQQDLELLFRSHRPLITIESREERRAVELLRSQRTALGRPLSKWSVTEGLVSTEFRFDLEGDHLKPAEVLRHIKARGRTISAD